MAEVQYDLSVPDTDKKRLVIIGGGFAGLNIIKSLPKNHNLQVVLLDKHNYHTFQPLLYQVATSGLEPDSMAEPLRAIFSKKRVHIRLAKVKEIDPKSKYVKTPLGNLSYDYLAIATGTRPNYFGNEEVATNAFALKSVPNALDLRSQILQSIERASVTRDPEVRQRLLNFVIVGGGPTGVEVAGALAEMRKHVLSKDYTDFDTRRIQIILVEGEEKLLPPMSEKSGKKALTYLENMGVDVRLNALVDSYDGKTAKLNDGSEIETETLIWAAGVTGDLIPGLAEETMEKGRYLVNEYNQVNGHEDIFAVGDIAFMKSDEYPKGHPGVAQVAIQQGQQLAKNLLRHTKGESLKPFSYFDKGSMAIVGRNKAVADLPNKWNLSGFLGWLTWIFVHIYYLVGFDNKIITVFNWAQNYLSYSHSNRLIIRPASRKNNADSEAYVAENELGG